MNKNINEILYILSYLDFDRLTTENLELIYQVIFKELDFDTANKLSFNIFSSNFLEAAKINQNCNLTYKSLEFLLRKKYLFKSLAKFKANTSELKFDEFIFQCYRSYNSTIHFTDNSNRKIKDLSSKISNYTGRSFYLNKGYRLFKANLTVDNLYYLSSLNIDLRFVYTVDNYIYAITYNSKIEKYFSQDKSSLCILDSYTSLNLINLLINYSFTASKRIYKSKYSDLNLSTLSPMTIDQLKQYIQSKGYSVMEYRNITKNCKQLIYDKATKTYKGFNYCSVP